MPPDPEIPPDTPKEDPAEDDLPLSETLAAQPVARIPSQRQLWRSSSEIPEGPEEAKPIAGTASKRAALFYAISYLIFFSFMGTLARLGLESLTFYTGAPIVTGVLWANVAGSLIMGFLIEDKDLFRRDKWGDNQRDDQHEQEQSKTHAAVKKTIPLYIGLTTGFCGCFTSFSAFMRDAFLSLANALPDPSLPTDVPIASRNGGYSFMALVAVIVVTVALSLSALIAGAHLALALTSVTPRIPFALARVLDRVVVILAWGCWLGTIFLAIWPPDRHIAPEHEHWRGRAVFALVFAPLGCLLRFWVSVRLNPRLPAFPLGTFVVNVFGTIVEGMAYDLQRVPGLGAIPAALVGCQVLQGVMDGFCGSATTVSTWVAELNGLSSRRHAYVYGLVSVVVSLAFLVVIMGSLFWTRGFAEPVC